jgi:hypothetical protein
LRRIAAAVPTRARVRLVIGIISAVQHVVAVGAQLTVEGHLSASDFGRSGIELAVSVGSSSRSHSASF